MNLSSAVMHDRITPMRAAYGFTEHPAASFHSDSLLLNHCFSNDHLGISQEVAWLLGESFQSSFRKSFKGIDYIGPIRLQFQFCLSPLGFTVLKKMQGHAY